MVEVLFPGSEHEMVTVYHQDGDDLLLTHYCSARNQPRMKCNGEAEPNLLRFEFVDATNMRSTNDPHMPLRDDQDRGPRSHPVAMAGLRSGSASRRRGVRSAPQCRVALVATLYQIIHAWLEDLT